MKKILSLFIIMGAALSTAVAQRDFKPGYVVVNAGDTLRGEVAVRSASRMDASCSFRPSATASATEYTPEQLIGYGLTEGDQFQRQSLLGSPAPVVFMRVLVLGSASLYEYTDVDGKTSFYFRKGATPLQALTQRDSTVRGDATQGQTPMVQQRLYLYRNVLWNAMADCPTAQVATRQTDLKKNSLNDAVVAYNKCAGNSLQYVSKRTAIKWQPEILGGMYRSVVEVKDWNGEQPQELSNVGPVLGVGFKASNVWGQRFSIHGQLMAAKMKYEKQYISLAESGLLEGTPVNRDVRISYSTIRLPVFIRYQLLTGTVRPYLQAGGMIALNFNRTGTETTFDDAKLSNYQTDLEIRSGNGGTTIGAGIAVVLSPTQTLNLEFRRDALDGLSASFFKVSGSRQHLIVLSYTLGK